MRKIEGNIIDNRENTSLEISFGTRNCSVISEPPQDVTSIKKPFMHLYTNSARFMHQATVIFSSIVWESSSGTVSVLTEFITADLRTCLRP